MGSPRVINPQVSVPTSRRGDARPTRSPEVHFDLIFKPFELQPCAVFPVLPGETLTSHVLQCQAWTDPLKAVLKNTPWHFEYYSFYVKFRDLPGWEIATDGIGRDLIHMIEADEDMSGHQDADGLAWTYCPPGGVDYVLESTKRVVECYFRDEGHAWDEATSAGGVPMVKLFGRGRRDVHDKLTLETDYVDARVPIDFDGDATATVDDLELAYREWAANVEGTEMSMDFEDWVKAAGGQVVARNEDREDLHVPEDLANVREFTYPTNTVEPSTGVPAVAAGWRLKKQARKMFRFPEWGWVICYVVARPKMLMLNQQGLYAAMMQGREHWFPPNFDPRLYQSHMEIDDAVGPLKAIMDTGNVDYLVDLRDLFNHGEQFVNYAPSQSSGAFASMPEADADRFYATAADAMSVFSDTTNGRIRANGVISTGFKSYPVVRQQQHGVVVRKI